MSDEPATAAATTNACKQCAPLGATLAYKGIEGTMPFIHGGQGCATYIRRYLISHFREPIDVASSSFTDETAIFGGERNLRAGIENVSRKYNPLMVGVSTTCLAETIGEDMGAILQRHVKSKNGASMPLLMAASTPSYRGGHVEGFNTTVRAIVNDIALAADPIGGVNILPGFLSCADLSHLKEIAASFALSCTLLPDYSETLDAPIQMDYMPIPTGGTTIKDIQKMAGRTATIELGRTLKGSSSAGELLKSKFGVPLQSLGAPIGIRENDLFFKALSEIAGIPVPAQFEYERGRLIDSYVDGHKYLYGKRAIVYGEEDLVVGLVSFLSEIGVKVVLASSGGTSGRFVKSIRDVAPDVAPASHEGMDFKQIEELADELKPDLMIGNSKGYNIARNLNIPLVRVGFPIHDRIGGQRVLCIGYRGTQRLYDEICNTLLSLKQEDAEISYSYM
jgi:nitrogenase molybdenum-iron protein NifN